MRCGDADNGKSDFVMRGTTTKRYEAIVVNRLDRVDALYRALVLSLLLAAGGIYALIAATA